MSASDLDIDPVLAQDLAVTLANSARELSGIVGSASADAGLTLPGTDIADASAAAITSVAASAQVLVSSYESLSTTMTSAIGEYQILDSSTAGEIAMQWENNA
ncbi:hypothetical protein [Nocardia cyriacigeorgica]